MDQPELPLDPPIDPDLPILPYGDTSGWSGSEASEKRARKADKEGVTAKRQRMALNDLLDIGLHGYTYQELGQRWRVGHGSVSGVLSDLHKAGLIARLAGTRNGCHVYVHPRWVDGREVGAYTPNAATRRLGEILREAAADLDAGQAPRNVARRLIATAKAYGV